MNAYLQRELTRLRNGHGLDFAVCLEFFGDDRESDPYARTAFEQYHRDGETEIADPTVVSLSDDQGAYVLAWVWVDDADAGIAHDEDDETAGGAA
jgi:hypothetical protein